MSRKSRRALAALIAGLAVPVGMLGTGAAANAAPQHQSATRTAVEDCGAGRALVRPHSLILACADSGELATHLHWSSWTRERATARGYVTWREGSAAVPSSRQWRSARAQFSLSNPVSEPGGKVLFTRLHMHVTGSTPRGFLRNLTFRENPQAALAPSQSHQALGRSVPENSPSGTLSYNKIEDFWIVAGGPGGVNGSETAAAITGAESSFLPGIIQPDQPYSTTGWGLWQITPGDSESADGKDFQLLDPWNNAEAAVAKYEGAGDSFTPWTTYNDGAYQQFMEGVDHATGLTDPGEYQQINSAPSGTHNSSDPGSTYGPVMCAPFSLCFYTGGTYTGTSTYFSAGDFTVGTVYDLRNVTPDSGPNFATPWGSVINDMTAHAVYIYDADEPSIHQCLTAGEPNKSPGSLDSAAHLILQPGSSSCPDTP